MNAHQFLGASNVYHVVKDRSGYLWFCTNYGLVKYNGRSIQRFTRQQGLPDNTVFNIFEDRFGRIWPFCYNGKYCFIYGDSIYSESNDSLLASLPHANSFITYMTENETGTMYLGFINKRILVIKNGIGKWVPWPHKEEPRGLTISNRKISLSTVRTQGFVRFDGDNKLIADTDGIKILIDSVIKWQLNDASLTEQSITDLYLTADSSLIAGTNHGLVIVDLITKKQSTLLKGIKVSGLAKDIAGNFWVSTGNNGIYVLHQELNNIHPIAGLEGLDCVNINDNRVVSIKDDVFYEFQIKDGHVAVVKHSQNVHSYYDPIMLTPTLAAFYNTWKAKTIILNKNGDVIFSDHVFFKRIYDRCDSIFVAFGKELVQYFCSEKTGLKFLSAWHYADRISTTSANKINGDVYFCSGENLYKCNFQTTNNDLVFSSPLLKGATSISVLDNCILVTADTSGYYSFSPINKNGSLYYAKTNFIVKKLLPVSGTRMLAFSDVADFIIDASNKKQLPQKIEYPFSSADYEHFSIIGNNCLVQIEGKLYYFDTALLNKNIPSPLLNIKRLVINDKVYSSDSIEIKNTMKLNIRVTIGVIDFGGNIQDLKYRLSGPDLDEKWIKTTSTELTFFLRKAGTYRIEVASGNNSKFVARTIIVHTPFLRSAVFFIMCGIVLFIMCGAAFLLVLRYREQHFLKEYNYLKLEHRAINALLNPHFIFNTINNIQSLILRSDRQDAAEYLSALSRLIRQNLENLQHNLIPLDNEIEMIHRYIKLQNLRFEGNISFVLNNKYEATSSVYIPPLLVHTFIENAIVHGYRERFQSFCITLSITKRPDNYLRIVIADNGIGIHNANKHPVTHQKTSMGVAFNQRRLDRLSAFYHLKQSITVNDLSTSGSPGTEVVIILYADLKTLFEEQHLSVYQVFRPFT